LLDSRTVETDVSRTSRVDVRRVTLLLGPVAVVGMTADGADTARVERTEGVGRIVMDRPVRHNTMDRPMAAALQSATHDLVDDDAVRCIVLTGTGAAFNFAVARSPRPQGATRGSK